MKEVRTGTALQTIFTIFLGLMVTAFVGVGVYTFYPSPDAQYRDQMRKLDREQQALHTSKPDIALTESDRARIQEITSRRDSLQDISRNARERWTGRTSIILVALSTVAMAISLIATAQLPVISNGLLLGGVFTMLYGVGWVIASGTSTTRFVVMTITLLITLALGYMRFVRRRAAASVSGAEGGGDTGLTELERRVSSLEDRMRQASSAFSGE